MFETGVRQLRMAISMVWGRRLDTRNLERLIDDARATIAEFGEPGADVDALIGGPPPDEATRAHIIVTNLKRTARRLNKQSPFYARRFASAGIDVDRFDLAALRRVPVTVKADIVRQPDDFLCPDAPRNLATRTTGTTGKPAEIWLSRYEMELWPALSALATIVQDEMRPTDVMQVNISSRATVSIAMDVAVCRLVGAGVRLLGIIPPDESLDNLSDGQVTLLSTPASYLAELVVAARRRGMSADDFTSLRGITVGGEILSPSVARAAQEMFGVPRINDPFGMTEVIPVTGRTCSQGHLHHDTNRGYVEYLDIDTGEPAAPGALATVVITPYFPYRDCMPVFRYDTRDMVRAPLAERLTCEANGLPGASRILGKADLLMRLGPDRVVTPRELVEAVEALPTEPWPGRFRAAVDNGRIALTLGESAVAGLGEAAAVAHFAAAGLDVDLTVVSDEEAVWLRTLRCDLRETTFVARPALIGA